MDLIDEYVTVYFDPAYVIRTNGDNSVLVSNLFVKAYRNKSTDIHVVSDIKVSEYAERCDEEWEAYKQSIIKDVKEENELLTDFDIN